MRFWRSVAGFFGILLCLAVCGPSAVARPVANSRGALLQLTALADLPPSACDDQLHARPHRYGPGDIHRYRIVYATVDAAGAPTSASGLLAFAAGRGPRSLVSYQHGTVLGRDDVPSRASAESTVVVCTFASGSYAVAAMDYLGYGDGPGFHPYLYAPSAATAGRDMLLAVAAAAAQLQLQLNGQLFLTGFSQGGHATLALQQDLEAAPLPMFGLRASAPYAGPYDLAGVTLTSTLDAPVPSSSNLLIAYTLTAYQHIYGNVWQSDPAAVFLPGFTDFPALYDRFANAALAARVPKLPSGMLQPRFIASLRAGEDSGFFDDLRRNTVDQWQPRTPLRLLYAGGDHLVSPENSRLAYAAFAGRGSPVDLENVGDGLDHGSGFPPAMQAALAFFAGFP